MKQVYPVFIYNTGDDTCHPSMEDNNEEIPVPSDREEATKKVKEYADEIDFSKGILTYVDVDFSEWRISSRDRTFFSRL